MWCPGSAHIQRNHIPAVQAEAKQLHLYEARSEINAEL